MGRNIFGKIERSKMNNEVLNERYRIRKIVIRKIDSLIEYRNEHIKSKRRRAIPMLEKLKLDIVFLIDNPDYVRKTNIMSDCWKNDIFF